MININKNNIINYKEDVKKEQELIDPSTGWKIYQNKEVGVEFEYPLPPEKCKYCGADENDSFSLNTVDFFVEDPKGLTLSEFINNKMDNFEITSKVNKIIGGKEWISVNYHFGGMGRFGESAFIEKDNKFFVLSFYAGSSCCPENRESIYEMDVFDAIVSTFKFL